LDRKSLAKTYHQDFVEAITEAEVNDGDYLLQATIGEQQDQRSRKKRANILPWLAVLALPLMPTLHACACAWRSREYDFNPSDHRIPRMGIVRRSRMTRLGRGPWCGVCVEELPAEEDLLLCSDMD